MPKQDTIASKIASLRYYKPVDLKERFLKQDERALARAISWVEAGKDEGKELLRSLRKHTGSARVIGITGSPGSGKSTLTDKLIAQARKRDLKVAVLAVDPTSPFSGGAILGDRIRMMQWHKDKDVYIRSMATRGHLGGLAAASLQIVSLLDAYGFDIIFIETVGVGQSEVDIVRVADSTLLILTPGQGDGVQAFKAGIMEIADIFIINKFDLPGAARLKREIRAALELGHTIKDGWELNIFEAIASQDKGLDEIYDELSKHHNYLKDNNKLLTMRKNRARFEISSLLSEQLRLALLKKEDSFIESVLNGELALNEAVKLVLEP